MISLNEGHNMEAVLENLRGWAQEVFLVDSCSRDDTLDIAIRHGVNVVQRRFRNFGDQWNFALGRLPITAPWTMKLDPDERLSDELKGNIESAIRRDDCDALSFNRRWWLMGHPLPIREKILRVWRTGQCTFTDVAVNEHPVFHGKVGFAAGDMEHLDSPDLEHWFDKQNRYSTAEAIAGFRNSPLAATPSFIGTPLQRRMWLKKNFYKIPFRYCILFLYFWLWRGLWRAGRIGYHSARLWTDVFRWKDLKMMEMRATKRVPIKRETGVGGPDARVPFHD